MTLEQLRELKEFRNVVDNNHAKELADDLNACRTVYYCVNGKGYRGTTDITDVLDEIEWNESGKYGILDGYIEIEVHEGKRVLDMEVPVEITVENWLEDLQCFAMESIEIKDIEEW